MEKIWRKWKQASNTIGRRWKQQPKRELDGKEWSVAIASQGVTRVKEE